MASLFMYQSHQASCFVLAQPSVHRVCLSGLAQSMLGHPVRRLTICYPQQCTGTLPQVCPAVAVAYSLQLSPLLFI